MNDIDHYLSGIDPQQASELQKIRRLIIASVPTAQQVMSYGMPGFKYKGKYLAGFCAFKDHLSFFPTPGPIAELKDQLQDYKISKGTIQFTLERPLPEPIIRQLLQARVSQIDRDKAK